MRAKREGRKRRKPKSNEKFLQQETVKATTP